jgi:hypothetical protein
MDRTVQLELQPKSEQRDALYTTLQQFTDVYNVVCAPTGGTHTRRMACVCMTTRASRCPGLVSESHASLSPLSMCSSSRGNLLGAPLVFLEVYGGGILSLPFGEAVYMVCALRYWRAIRRLCSIHACSRRSVVSSSFWRGSHCSRMIVPSW